MARPRKVLDREMVVKLAAMFCTVDEIAACLEVSKDTIERRCKAELESGRQKGKASLRRKQYALAMDGDRVMLIWLGKQYLGQKDKIDFSEADGFEFADKDSI